MTRKNNVTESPEHFVLGHELIEEKVKVFHKLVKENYDVFKGLL